MRTAQNLLKSPSSEAVTNLQHACGCYVDRHFVAQSARGGAWP